MRLEYITTGVFIAWLIFNWLAPLSLLSYCQRISIGRIPKNILDAADAHHVRFYVGKLERSAAFSTWLGWRHAVVLDRDFMHSAPSDVVRFVLAHELGHCVLGHLRLRWLLTVTALAMLPSMRRYLDQKEGDADAYAEALTGVQSMLVHKSN